MADVETVGGQWSEAVRVGIDVLQFRRLNGGIFLRASALVQYQNVAQLDVLDVMTRNSGDDRGLAGGAVGADDIADQNPPQLSHRSSFGSPHPAAQTEKEGNVDDVPHGDIGDGDVFEQRAIPRLQRDSPAILNHAVGYGDVTEATVAFRTEFDPPVAGNLGIRGEAFVSGIEHGAFFIAAGDVAVGDGNVVGGSGKSQAVGIFQANAVIPWRVDA